MAAGITLRNHYATSLEYFTTTQNKSPLPTVVIGQTGLSRRADESHSRTQNEEIRLTADYF